MAQVKKLTDKLLAGKAVSNGTHTITFNKDRSFGYLCCYDPGCCDGEFYSIEEILDFIDDDIEYWD